MFDLDSYAYSDDKNSEKQKKGQLLTLFEIANVPF